MNNLKIKFDNFENINNNYSQSGQDIFVLSCLNGKKDGLFLDLGCRHPTEINNTFLLEKNFNWRGISIDIDEDMINLFSSRKTIAKCLDATNLNFDILCEEINSTHFDYLSLDLEPASVTQQCLENIPFSNIKFSVITFEHDFYRFGEVYRNKSREILEKNGYKIICSNVKNNNFIYEDWYYNEKYVDFDRIKILKSESSDWKDILFF